MKLRKILPHVIALVLISAICILSAVVLLGERKKTEPNATFATDDTQLPNVTGAENNILVPVIKPYYTEYPKAALPDETFLYTQTVQGKGDVRLCAFHQTTLGYYIIAESDCQYGDTKTDHKSIVVFTMDTLGNINGNIVLNSRLPMTFQSSKITSSGIVIAGNTSENLYLYTLEYDMSGYTVDTFPYASRATLYFMTDGLMLYAESSQDTLYAIGETTSVAFAPAGRLVAAYDFLSYRLAFVSRDDSYVIAKYNKKMQCISTITVDSQALITVLPFSVDGKQYFLAAETDGSKTSLIRYDMTFSRDSAMFSSLGHVDELTLMQGLNEFLLILTGSTQGVYSVNETLEFSPKNTDVFSSVTDISSFVKGAKGYRFIAESNSSIYLLNLNDDGTSESVYIGYGTDGLFAESANGTVTVCRNAIDKEGNLFIQIVGLK